MGDTTGISWTDSTQNFWEGCTKVGPGCDHCYAEDRDKRYHGGEHWGPGAPRRRMAEHTRNAPRRWQRKAEEFVRLRGHHQRVFCSSLADIFDNEVPEEWRKDAWMTMTVTPDLRWQLCTKRVSNVEKMVPAAWRTGHWLQNVGLLITTVTQEEIDRDLPRLRKLKESFGLPWVGLSVEPMIERIELPADAGMWLDWVIIGGESGPEARPFDLRWGVELAGQCGRMGIATFVKQMGNRPMWFNSDLRHHYTGKGANPAEWLAALRVQQFPLACS